MALSLDVHGNIFLLAVLLDLTSADMSGIDSIKFLCLPLLSVIIATYYVYR